MSTINYDWFIGKHLACSILIFGCGLVIFRESHTSLSNEQNNEIWEKALKQLKFVRVKHNTDKTLFSYTAGSDLNQEIYVGKIETSTTDLPSLCSRNRKVQIISYVLLLFGVATVLPVLLVSRPMIVS